MIERKIIIGLIVSTEFIKELLPIFNPLYLASNTSRLLAKWVIEFYNKYEKAPGVGIEDIYFKKLQNKEIDKESAEELENEILPDLSEEYENEEFDVDYYLQESIQYLKKQKLLHLASQIEGTIEQGVGAIEERIKDAENLATDFKPIEKEKDESLDLSSEDGLEAVEKAFEEKSEPVFTLPGQFGSFINEHLIPGGFVSFLATEKRGKTWLVLEIAKRAAKQGKNVGFFQAGDMNESAQLIRFGINLTKTSNKEKYCNEHHEAVRDCINNQRNTCEHPDRECDFGVFEDMEMHEILELKMPDYIEALKNFPDYEVCYNCKKYDRDKLGAVWVRKVEKKLPLKAREAKQAYEKFFHKKYKGRIRLSTHANGTLSFNLVENILDVWEKEGFVCDVLLFDYFDIMVAPDLRKSSRDQENDKWKYGRKLSQTERQGVFPLVVTPTQADSEAYSRHNLGLRNFSEDKRKYAHVTAMFGLNQDKHGRDKSLGLLRVNPIIMREGELNQDDQVVLIGNLRQGRIFKQSCFSKYL